MIIKQVNPTDSDVVALIEELNAYQIGLYGVQYCNLEPPESLAQNAFMIGVFVESQLVGIGALKKCLGYGEIKRMYVKPNYRRTGIAKTILKTLEACAAQAGLTKINLETGRLHSAALALYKQLDYHPIQQFGDYTPNEVSLYLQKNI